MLWRTVAVVIALLSAVVGALSLLWLAGEAHYQSCLNRIEVRYPATKQISAGLGRSWGDRAPFKEVPNPQRDRVQDCSRLPF